jgi:micrococcal nuclease
MYKRILVVIVLFIIIAGAYLIFKEFTPNSDGIFEVSQIIDGDTIRLSNGEKVRLIGINAPEQGQPFYNEATEKLRELIGDEPVTLEKDVDDEDQYGRLLRYIYVNETFVNVEMVRQGFAISYPFSPNTKYTDKFEEAQEDARISQIGIWSPSEFSGIVIHMHADAEGDDNENLNDEYVIFENGGNSSLNMTGWTVQDEANNFYIFSTFFLENGHDVTLYSGADTDTTTKVYWESSKPIWNNDGDSLYLRDAAGFLVTYYSY